jgi:hypothetical protein
MKALRPHEFLRAAVRIGSLATFLVGMPVGTVWAAGPILWSLKKPAGSDPLAGWGLPVPARTNDGGLSILPDPTDNVGTTPTAAAAAQDFSIAPSVDNILNRRHDLSEDQMGEPGSSSSYLRSVGRTFGLALKKSLY